MPEQFEQPVEQKIPDPATLEQVEIVSRLLAEAEATFETGAREATIPLLTEPTNILIKLNHPNLEAIKAVVDECIRTGDYDNLPSMTPDEINPLVRWNPEGKLSEAQFDELVQRRKKLSVAVGGKVTATGEIRTYSD